MSGSEGWDSYEGQGDHEQLGTTLMEWGTWAAIHNSLGLISLNTMDLSSKLTWSISGIRYVSSYLTSLPS